MEYKYSRLIAHYFFMVETIVPSHTLIVKIVRNGNTKISTT
jgi:hypothetical protein